MKRQTKQQKIKAWRAKRRQDRKRYFKDNPGAEAQWKAIHQQLHPHRAGKL
jgi:hypothetical protein